MVLLGLSGVTVAHGGPPVLDEVALVVEEGERIGLLGRNASGKSTLLAVIAGDVVPDAGERTMRQGLTVARLPQEVPRGLAGRVGDLVSAATPSGEEAWRSRERLERLFTGLRLDPDAEAASLSAGLARRALLARTLAASPDLLLLDEPTNHLDVEAIRWLESHLLQRGGATLFVTHDRAFLRRLATRILETDRGRLTSWPGDYENYLRRQEERAADEARRFERADQRLAKEEVWRRKGVKAQRTRGQARIEALERLRRERRERRAAVGTARMAIADAERSGRLVVEAIGLVAGHAGTNVVGPLDLAVMRGDRVGLVGPNGSGKTTLARTLIGELPPVAGTVRRGVNLQIAWYDPLHASLDPEKTVGESVTDGTPFVEVGGKRRHVVSYLGDFLFEPGSVGHPVKRLSGGERARLLLARLFARPSNVLVLDEPTNDLDAETLDVLEDALLAYAGTVLVVSHDRDFLDQAVTNLLVFDGAGGVREVVGGWSDWERIEERERAAAREAQEPARRPDAAPSPRASGRDRRAIERIERSIERLEAEQSELMARMSDPAFWTSGEESVRAVRERSDALAREIREAYDRWTALQD
jgi:ATP-binding cassette subfamily F protein uup